MLATLAGSHELATLSADAQSCWWQYMSMASLGLPALTNSSSASPNLPVSHGNGDACQSNINETMSGDNNRQQQHMTPLDEGDEGVQYHCLLNNNNLQVSQTARYLLGVS